MKIAIVVFITLLSAASAIAQGPAADLIITNAKIWTVDQKHPRAEALAVLGDRIVAVGTAKEISAWRGTKTQVIDAQQHLVLPGFNDAHVHFTSGGFQLDSVDLKDAASPQEFARRIGAFAKTRPKGEWILGGDWDEQHWAKPELPTRQMIDAVTPDNPVFVNRHDGHMAVANSLALKHASVTRHTKDVAGGEIVRDANGEPTGLLKDAAMDYVYKAVPDPTPEQRTRAVKRALAHAASVGVTSVQDMGPSAAEVATYAELAERGELTARIYAAQSIMRWDDQAKAGVRRAFGSPYLRIGGVKGFADGSLGSTTAYFFQPYVDAPQTRGLLNAEMLPLEKMQERMTGSDKAGLQLCIHAIGDAAISTVLDMFSEVQQKNGAADRRWRIEHSQHVAPKDFDRYAQLKVIASVQPYHAIDDGRWAEKRIGPKRIKTTYAFRTFLDKGVRLAFGTDWTVAPLDPMWTIYAAVTRRTLDDKNPNGWVPEQKVTVQEAVEAYTMGSAYAEFMEQQKGSLTPGKLADFVILSDDIFTVAPERIKDVKAERTVVGGKNVYLRTSP